MAAPWQGLGAHQHDALACGPCGEPGQVVRKLGGLHVVGVPAEGKVAPSRVHGPWMCAAESSQARKLFIADASGRELGRTHRMTPITRLNSSPTSTL